MSVMQRRELQELALGLTQLLEIEIPENTNPLEPGIILSALAILFPEAESQLQEIVQFQEFEQQWSCILEFIEINMLGGQRLEVESLGIQEIAEIYQLIIQYTQQALEENEESQYQEPQKAQKPDRSSSKMDVPKKEKVNSRQKQIKKQKPTAILEKSKPAKNNKIKNSNQQYDSKNAAAKEQVVAQKLSKDKLQSKNQSKSHSKSKNKGKQKIQQTNKAQQNKVVEKKSPIKPSNPIKAVNIIKEPLQNELIKQITTAMKASQKKPKNKILLKDPKSTQEVLKAKRQFQHYLNQFKNQGKKKIKVENKLKKSGLDQYFLKALQKRQKNIQQTVINEQLKYFLTLRDKKVAFINKIHSLTQKLERQRLIQKQKEQRRLMEEQRSKTHTKIIQSNALFQKNMELLKENYKAIRQKNELQDYDERIICKQMQQCMKQKKLNQLQDLKMLWQQENMKLNNIMGDQQKIKNKLIDIYRRNRP